MGVQQTPARVAQNPFKMLGPSSAGNTTTLLYARGPRASLCAKFSLWAKGIPVSAAFASKNKGHPPRCLASGPAQQLTQPISSAAFVA